MVILCHYIVRRRADEGWPICSERVAYFTPKGRPVCSEKVAGLVRKTQVDNVYVIDTNMFGFPHYQSTYLIEGKKIALIDTGLPSQLDAVRFR